MTTPVGENPVASIAGGPSGIALAFGSKAGVECPTHTLAVEWAEHGIRASAVGSRYAHTTLTDCLTKEGKPDGTPVINRIPMRREEPSQTEAPLNFLASTEASFITGQSLLADGGMTVNGKRN